MKITRGSLILLAIGVVVLAAFAASASASASKSKFPPCTTKALRDGLNRGSQTENAKLERPFGCADGWAYSLIQIGGPHGFNVITVYTAKNGVWVAINRADPCRTHAIPRKIYRDACR